MSEALPKGWTVVKLDELAEINMGQAPPSETYNLTGEGLPFFQGKTEFGERYPIPVKFCSKPPKVAERDDVLISVRAPVGPTNLCPEKSCIGRGLAAIRPRGEIPSLFLFHYFRHIEPWLSEQGTGSTFTAINRADLAEISILVPPLNEQRRIAAKLDVVLAKVNTCQKRLAKAPALLKRFRQAVLAAACSGRLTADWRENHESEDWRSVIISDVLVGSFYGPRFGAEDYSDVGIPTIRTTDMDFRGGINLVDSPRVKLSPEQLRHYGLQDGDLLVTRTGATIGKCALYVAAMGPAMPSAYLIRFRLNKTLIEPRFALMFLMSPLGQAQLLGGSTAVAQPNVNAKAIAAFMLELPPVDEQHEIVRRVEALFALADTLEARHTKARAQVDRLTQSILAKAFRGELVPQDPNDEPADALLARLRAAHADRSPTRRRGRGRPPEPQLNLGT